MFRIGYGYDVHALAENRKLILCGVTIPHERGLFGHSDADVAIHALMDALIGALALGDIGKFFPDTDPQYKDINSMHLLELLMENSNFKNYEICNLDITIIAQRPKVAPYIDQMKINLINILDLAYDQVSIKATTTEKLGFCGREEGIAATAAVLLKKI